MLTSDSILPSFDYSKEDSFWGKHHLSKWTGEGDKNHRGKYNLIHILQLILSRRRCLIWMIIWTSDSTISFSLVVKLPDYHPSDSGTIPARVLFYILFFFFFLFFIFIFPPFIFWFYGPSRLFHSFWAESIVRSGDEPREKPPDHPRVERLVSHVTCDRLESSAVIRF